MAKVGFVEWPHGLTPFSAPWLDIKKAIDAAGLDILVTNELPFGDWISSRDRYDATIAAQNIAIHETGLKALAELAVGAVISSRPVSQAGRLANEAFILAGGKPHVLHQKRYFPAEEGWHEATWFAPGEQSFTPARIADLNVGCLLCTDVMFNEHARQYGRKGVDLIVVPRATGDDYALWQTACSMAAIVSGSYVVSSNRQGQAIDGPAFGGRGMAFSPEGQALGFTTPGETLQIVEIDVAASRRQKLGYPCYVKE